MTVRGPGGLGVHKSSARFEAVDHQGCPRAKMLLKLASSSALRAIAGSVSAAQAARALAGSTPVSDLALHNMILDDFAPFAIVGVNEVLMVSRWADQVSPQGLALPVEPSASGLQWVTPEQHPLCAQSQDGAHTGGGGAAEGSVERRTCSRCRGAGKGREPWAGGRPGLGRASEGCHR